VRDALLSCAKAAAEAVRDLDDPGAKVGLGYSGAPTSRLDRVAEDAILAKVDELGLAVNVLTEERGLIDRGHEDLMVCDPVDGTVNALRGIGFWGVSLAVGLLSKVKVLYKLNKYFHADRAPMGLTFKKFLESFEGYQDRTKRITYEGEGARGKVYNTLFIAGMHFMDGYNFSVERVMRCVIHYPDLDGHLYPFCAYNGAPVYRKRVESKYKHSAEELKAKIEAEGNPKELEKLAKKMGL